MALRWKEKRHRLQPRQLTNTSTSIKAKRETRSESDADRKRMVSERAKAKAAAAQLHMGIHWTFYPASRCSESGDLEGLWCVRKGDEARIGSDRFAWELDASSWLAALSF